MKFLKYNVSFLYIIVYNNWKLIPEVAILGGCRKFVVQTYLKGTENLHFSGIPVQ